jgi:hypothetical protein
MPVLLAKLVGRGSNYSNGYLVMVLPMLKFESSLKPMLNKHVHINVVPSRC